MPGGAPLVAARMNRSLAELLLSGVPSSGMLSGVNFLRPLLVMMAIAVFTGCAGLGGGYHEVRVTDPRGVLVADYITSGWVERVEGGYRFRALQRLSGGPWPQLIRYPEGRIVEATGPNILISRCGPPAWLQTSYVGHTRVVDRSKD